MMHNPLRLVNRFAFLATSWMCLERNVTILSGYLIWLISSPLVPFHTLSYASSYLSDCAFVFFFCTSSLFHPEFILVTVCSVDSNKDPATVVYTHKGLFSPMKENPGTECPELGCNILAKATDSQVLLLFGPLDVASVRPLHSQCDC